MEATAAPAWNTTTRAGQRDRSRAPQPRRALRPDADDDLERLLLRGVPEDHVPEEHRRGHRVDEPRRQRDVVRPDPSLTAHPIARRTIPEPPRALRRTSA